MKYAEALEVANRAKPARPTELVSNAGGRARYATFRTDGDDVVARLFKTDIVRWHTDGTVTLNSGGYRTATTKEAMCSLIGQCSVFSEKKIMYVIDRLKGRVVFHDGIQVVIDPAECDGCHGEFPGFELIEADNGSHYCENCTNEGDNGNA